MKRVISILLIFILLFSIAGCSQKAGDSDKATAPASGEQAGDKATTPVSGAQADDKASGGQVVDKEAAFKAEPAASRTIHIGYDGGLCQAAIQLHSTKVFLKRKA
jgi:NitT/TauT family transport system substrate-binding protein